jgi:hypothetical protein
MTWVMTLAPATIAEHPSKMKQNKGIVPFKIALFLLGQLDYSDYSRYTAYKGIVFSLLLSYPTKVYPTSLACPQALPWELPSPRQKMSGKQLALRNENLAQLNRVIILITIHNNNLITDNNNNNENISFVLYRSYCIHILAEL